MEKTDVREPELMDENAITGGEEQLVGISADLIRGHINTIILRTLYDEDKYGYDIMDEIERKSGGLYKLKPPTLYSALKRLESLGYVTSYEGEFSNGGRRKWLHLTEQGREVAKRNLSEWEFSRTIIDSLISDGGDHYDFSFIAEKQTELEELKRSLATRETAIEAEKSALAALKNELQRERSLLATQNADLSSKRNDLGEFNEKIQAQKEELAAQALALSEKEGELEAKELALQEKQAQLQEAQETIRSLEEALNNANKQAEEYLSAVNTQAEELKETESALLSLQQEYSAMRLELLTLRQSQTTNTAQLDQIETLQTQLQEKENRLVALEKSLQLKEDDLEKRETALASAQIELSEKNAASYELLSKISSDQLRLDNDRAEFEKSKLDATTANNEKTAELMAQIDLLRDERDAFAEKADALEAQKNRLETEKAEIEAFAAEIERKERELNEKLHSFNLDENRTIADREQFAKEQLSLAEQQEQLKRLSEQLRYEQELMKQRQAELTTRLELFNQQQLDYLAKKQALTLQQFENEDKYATHAAQVKHLNDTMMAFEAEKSSFAAEKTAFEDEKKAFEAEKTQFREEKRRAAESNRVFVDSLNAKEDAFRREEARLQALGAELERRAAELNAQPRTPAHSPAMPTYETPYYVSGNPAADELYKRAERDGIRLNSRTAPVRTPAAAYAKPAKPAPTFNKGATIFKSALLTFCLLAIECIIVYFMKDTLGVPFYYPLIPMAAGLVFFATCSILYASGYQSNARLNKKSGGSIFSAVILFFVGVITASMVAVYCRAPLGDPMILLSYILLPAIFLTNLILYPIFYHFFAISNKNKEENEE